MNKAVETAVDFDDEEGAAESAASLGADGGPLVAAKVDYDDELEDIDLDESWLDEDLSDEELAALSEGFDDEELLAEELGLDIDEEVDGDAGEVTAFTDPDPSPDPDLVPELDPVDDANDFSFDPGAPEQEPEIQDDEPAFPESALDAVHAATREVDHTEVDDSDDGPELTAAGAGAVVAATSILPDQVGGELDETALEELVEEEVDHRPVPRISIHAFCETPETTALLERAAVDRRLSKTHLTMHMGGLPKAIDHFQTAATPNLIIVETVESGKQLFERLGELAEVCDPSTKVIIIGQINDITLYRELMRQGISEYIVQPRSPLQIITSIASLYVDPSAPPIGKTIAFVGARGGVGSSSLAHNVAWCTAEEYESDTVILDLDLPFGTASLDFEQDPTSGLVEALASPERLDDVLLDRLLQKHTDRLSLFTAPNLLDRDYDLDDQAFETVIDVVRAAAPTIIIDVPHIWTSWSKRLLQTADEIVITATSDLASFRNTKNLVDIISSSRPNDAPPILVINQFDAKLSSVQPDQYEEHVGLKPSLVIGWEPQLFHTASTNASPIIEVGAKTKTAQGIRDLAAQILGRSDVLKKQNRFSLSGLFKKK